MLNFKSQKRKRSFRLTAMLLTVSLFSYASPAPVKALAAEKREVIVAVIDTGVNVDHELLRDSIWVNCDEIPGNGLDDDHNGYVDDIYGWDFYNDDPTVFHDILISDTDENKVYEDDHGTHVAGIIVSNVNKGKKILGKDINVNVKLMILKVNGGAESGGTTKNAVKAIKYAEAKGATICNLSWGGYNSDGALQDVIERSGMLFICCAGNDATDNDLKPIYPANYEYGNVLSVTGAKVGKTVELAGNYGKTSVDVCADGFERNSSLSHGYGQMSGASMATAEVSGIAAFLMSAGGLSVAKVRNCMIDLSEKIEGITGVTIKGGLSSMESLIRNYDGEWKKSEHEWVSVIFMNYNEITIEEGKGFRLNCLLLPAGNCALPVFSSSDPDVASVSYNGLVYCKKQGEAIVSVSVEGAEGFCRVHVR